MFYCLFNPADSGGRGEAAYTVYNTLYNYQNNLYVTVLWRNLGCSHRSTMHHEKKTKTAYNKIKTAYNKDNKTG